MRVNGQFVRAAARRASWGVPATSVARSAIGAALVLAVAAPSAAAARAPEFAGATSVRDVQVSCITRGSDRGRVALDVSVRYADATDAAASGHDSHRTRSSLTVRSRRGKLLARHTDRGTAQVAIPSRDWYLHVHRHALSAAQSRAVLGGRTCREGLDRSVRVRVRATQTLSGGRSASSAQTTARAAQSGGVARQGATAAVTASVQPTASVPDNINGCLRAGTDWNCQGVDLDGVDLSGQLLAYADFSFASMKNADLHGARLGHVIMNLTTLDGANLNGALFGSASLTSTSLIGADLTGAVGPFANLANAKLNGAKLAGARLGNTNLPGAVFDNATCDATTVFPGVFPHRCTNGVVVSG